MQWQAQACEEENQAYAKRKHHGQESHFMDTKPFKSVPTRIRLWRPALDGPDGALAMITSLG